MVGASFFLSIMAVFARIAGSRLPSIEVVLGRSIVTTALSYWALSRAGVSPWGNRRDLLLLRGVAGFLGLTCFFYAVTKLPLGAVTVIHFTSPVFTVLIAGLFLGEGLRRRELSTTTLSFGGILLVARPTFLFGGDSLDPFATVVAVCGAIMAAVAYVMVRRLAATEHALVIVFWFSFIGVVGSAPFAAAQWVTPLPWEWAAILAVGIATQAGQVLLTKALALDRASKVMQAGYVQILFAGLWGFVLFGEVPHLSAAFGTVAIVGSLALLTRPRPGGPARPVARSAPATAPPPPPWSPPRP